MRHTRWMMIPALAIILLCSGGCTRLSIWEYSRNGNYDQVKKYLEEKPELVNAEHHDAIKTDFDNRWSPLRYAVETRQYRTAELLLDHGADPLQPAHSNYTPYDAARSDPKLERMLREKIEASGKPLP